MNTINYVDKNIIETVGCARLRLLTFFNPIQWNRCTMSLTKDDIVKSLAKENGYPLNQSVDIVETVLEIIKSTL